MLKQYSQNNLRLQRYRRYKKLFDGLYSWISNLSDKDLLEKINVRNNDDPKKLRVGFKVYTQSHSSRFMFSERLAKIKRDFELATNNITVFSLRSSNGALFYLRNQKQQEQGIQEALDHGLIWLFDGKSMERIKKIVSKIVKLERDSRKNGSIMSCGSKK